MPKKKLYGSLGNQSGRGRKCNFFFLEIMPSCARCMDFQDFKGRLDAPGAWYQPLICRLKLV